MKRTNSNKIGKYISIYKRDGSGNWYYSYRKNGKQVSKSLGTSNLGRASILAKEIDDNLQKIGEENSPAVIDMPESIDDSTAQFLEYLKSEGRRESTIKRYCPIFRNFNEFCKVRLITKFTDFNQRTLDLYRKERTKKCSDSNRYLESKCIVAYGKYLLRSGIVSKAPFSLDGIKKPKVDPLRWYSKNNVEDLLAIASKKDAKIFEFLAFTGLRISELQRLVWDEVDLETGFIHILSTINDPTKSGYSRSVPIHFRVRKILTEIKDKSGFIFNAGKSKKFPNGDGPIHERRLLSRVKKLCDRLEIEGCLHSFRKFFCSYMANSGVPPATLIKWSGHQDLKVFMDHYYNLTDNESLNIMDRFDPKYSANKTAENYRGQTEDSFEDTLSMLKINAS